MLIAEMPELGRMTFGEAAAMTGLAPVPHGSGTMRGKRAIAGGRRTATCLVPGRTCRRLSQSGSETSRAAPMMRGKLHKLVIVAIARRLVTIANAILKTGVPWQHNLIT